MPDYNAIETIEYNDLSDSITIYGPAENDLTGYHTFPSTPYVARLQLIELRGDSLKDGFKLKEQYKDAYISTYGTIEKENIFD